jgi:hypothetical protein
MGTIMWIVFAAVMSMSVQASPSVDPMAAPVDQRGLLPVLSADSPEMRSLLSIGIDASERR